MNKNDKEVRSIQGIELRVDDPEQTSRKVGGYAIRFNEPSQYLGFYETILPNAITQEEIDNADIFCFYNHDSEKVLARSINGEGTLHLEVREDGVWYEFDAPETTTGDELLEHIKRGELFGTSFGFALDPDKVSDTWEKKDDVWYRTINHIDYLFEVSPVFTPAYTTTTCSKRSLEKIEEMEGLEKKLDEEMNEIVESVKKYID